MNLVDSSGWLEYFAGGANAEFFTAPIEDLRRLIVPSICLFEVFKRVVQQRSERDALRDVAHMQQGRVVDLDGVLALSAARLSVQMKLPLADSVILATARAHEAVIWTQDADFASMPGVKYIAKKPSR